MNPQQQAIYQLYEANIGIIVPLIAQSLNAAANTYPYSWIECAVGLAVKNNARSWRYVEAILKRWQVDGFDGMVRRATTYKKRGQVNERRDSVESRRRYAEWDK